MGYPSSMKLSEIPKSNKIKPCDYTADLGLAIIRLAAKGKTSTED